jgi:hypothetical protein
VKEGSMSVQKMKPIKRSEDELRFVKYSGGQGLVHAYYRGLHETGRTKKEAEKAIRAKARSMKGGR